MNTKIGRSIHQFTTVNCLFNAIQKDGRTLDQIIEDVRKEKAIELEVMNIHELNPKWGNKRILIHLANFKNINITTTKISDIIKFDKLGLSYRKINSSNSTNQ